MKDFYKIHKTGLSISYVYGECRVLNDTDVEVRNSINVVCEQTTAVNQTKDPVRVVGATLEKADPSELVEVLFEEYELLKEDYLKLREKNNNIKYLFGELVEGVNK